MIKQSTTLRIDVRKNVDTKITDTVIYNNNINMLGAATTVKNFIKFLFEMKVCIGKSVGRGKLCRSF